MRCKGMEDKLVAYLDGRARPAERRAVEEHLAVCADCRSRADEFSALWGVLDDLSAISPSPAFETSLRARLAAEPARRGLWPWVNLPSQRLAFAATALIALAVWVSSLPQATRNPSGAFQPLAPDVEFSMIRDLPELENYEVISSFDALSELPVAPNDLRQHEAGEESR